MRGALATASYKLDFAIIQFPVLILNLPVPSISIIILAFLCLLAPVYFIKLQFLCLFRFLDPNIPGLFDQVVYIIHLFIFLMS